jgi:hypothetical protein
MKKHPMIERIGDFLGCKNGDQGAQAQQRSGPA